MTSLLGQKIGMTQIFDEAGNIIPVTVVEAGPCVVTQLKTTINDGYDAIQVGFGQSKHLNRPQQGHLKTAKSRFLKEFAVSKPEEYQVGQEIKLDVFKLNDVVSVTATSIGKGFQGTIKRHHHHRGPMSHGSKSHRITGSIGAGTTPGRVFKGRGMAGHMGAAQVTQPSLRIARVDTARNLLLLAGAVPGKSGNLVFIRKTGEYKPPVQTKHAADKKAEKPTIVGKAKK
ncbi:50S ribosomal protein L3 [Candidatus Saganbacteria bacterium]|nr:50S ribosomal protein L3 [Candidatus Saganbacteria bacterium]